MHTPAALEPGVSLTHLRCISLPTSNPRVFATVLDSSFTSKSKIGSCQGRPVVPKGCLQLSNVLWPQLRVATLVHLLNSP